MSWLLLKTIIGAALVVLGVAILKQGRPLAIRDLLAVLLLGIGFPLLITVKP